MIVSSKWKLLALCGTIAMIAGCVRSLNPLYTQDDIFFDQQLLGEWTSQDAETSWEFTQRGKTAYRLKFTDQQDREALFTVHLFRLGETEFVDFYPVRKDVENPDFFNFHIVRVHSFARVDRQGSELKLSFPNHAWLRDYLQETPADLEHQIEQDGQLLLTASTEQLQAFFQMHLDNEEAFAAPVVLERD